MRSGELPGPSWDAVGYVVERCERYAAELFDGDAEMESYTGVTTWRDGDFRIHVQHGKQHDHSPYSQRVEEVTYHHEEGSIVYAEYTRFIDTRRKEFHDQEVLEEVNLDD